MSKHLELGYYTNSDICQYQDRSATTTKSCEKQHGIAIRMESDTAGSPADRTASRYVLGTDHRSK